MGNTSSRRTIPQAEEKIATAKPSSSSSLLPSSSLLACAEATRRESRNPRQIRRSVSLDGVCGRLNESFRRISSSLSCTALSNREAARRRSTTHSRSRPWSRVSRRRWHESTLTDELLLSKTCWPVTNAEALFLPHFPVVCNAEKNYRCVEYVANGAFGKVYKVERTISAEKKQYYALKVLSKAEIIDSIAIGQLKDEVDIQTVCGHHPFLARCVRYWQNKKKVFVLSDFYPNGELFQKSKQFPHELVRLYVAEIALALDFLHQAGIIYRDLKPENVLLDQDYHVRLIDFGLSKWLSIGSRTRTLCGTLQYMAPEVLSGEPYGHAVDWWALGVLACRMYTGQYPQMNLSVYLNKSEEIDKLIGQALPGQNSSSEKLLPDSVVDLPAEAQDLLKRLLEVKPQYRLRSLLQLQRIGLYKNYDWDSVKQKQVSPKQMIDAQFCGTEDGTSVSVAVAARQGADTSFEFDW